MAAGVRQEKWFCATNRCNFTGWSGQISTIEKFDGENQGNSKHQEVAGRETCHSNVDVDSIPKHSRNDMLKGN